MFFFFFLFGFDSGCVLRDNLSLVLLIIPTIFLQMPIFVTYVTLWNLTTVKGSTSSPSSSRTATPAS
ncbi:hypothetical protein HanOQP8_Chr10g0354781 [Helianthus annuus]|nr:hypothetical protein HanOQP8_Chr10g0354781 [Helianthus annuus]